MLKQRKARWCVLLYSVLLWSATWDEVPGVPVSLTGPNGAVQTFGLDALQRPVHGTQQVSFDGPQYTIVEYAYILDGSAPGPRTITTARESDGLADRVTVAMGSREPRRAAMAGNGAAARSAHSSERRLHLVGHETIDALDTRARGPLHMAPAA